MKKLNRKGFTLIELLAVIVILAIVMVVTIPSVINSLNSAREKSLENAADSVAEWFQKQYELDDLSSDLGSAADAAYTDFAYTNSTFNLNSEYPLTPGVLEAAGINDAAINVDTTGTNSTVYFNNKKVCVKLTAANGKSFWSTASGAEHTKTSGNCPTS